MMFIKLILVILLVVLSLPQIAVYHPQPHHSRRSASIAWRNCIVFSSLFLLQCLNSPIMEVCTALFDMTWNHFVCSDV